ncbi:hypothetical protein [Halotia branconii]|uniref:Uncharacterized protein n=1 Tax=Halotia branconii CENA392 TaxID=1539056 RepID=A0AAJ6NX12_9CYAN|nr:hypothetical protein [Halotia branconii]WGV28315.1 hypothetical protein QI031_12955 [Halotia branconii CENA392]
MRHFSCATLLTLLLTTPVTAQQVPPQVINGVLHQESRFFRQGREEFEKEIQLLLRKSLNPPASLLKVHPIKTQEQRSPNENPQIAPNDFNKSFLQKSTTEAG